MFMMPYLSQITRSRFPIAVIFLVLVNAIVFFGPQALDEKRYQRMAEYYAQSVLPNIELPAYVERLKRGADKDKARNVEEWVKRRALFPVLRTMEQDEAFMRDLHEGRVVTEDNAQYWEWKQARRHYEDLNHGVFTERFHFDTEHPSALTAFSHQFLHGDTGHIVGNMIVLSLVGPAVEALLGGPVFLLLYLASGVAAAFSHMFLSHATGGLVGASGAISGVMGAFAVLLGMRRIPFFYFVFVYFDVVRAPALLALPIWLANEAVQLLWLGNEHVAYGAHLGGLVVGALLAFPFRRRALALLESGKVVTEKPAEAPKTVSESALGEARRLMKAQRFDEARRAYAKAAPQAKGDVAVLKECLNIAKLAPASAEYHAIVAHVLALRSTDSALHALVLETFRDYVQKAKPAPQLAPETIATLAQRFIALRCLPELDRAVRLMHDLAPDHPDLPKLLAHAAHSLRQGGDPTRAAELLKLKPAMQRGGAGA